MTTDTQRAAFEAWWRSEYPNERSEYYLAHRDEGQYRSSIEKEFRAFIGGHDAPRGTAEQVRRDALEDAIEIVIDLERAKSGPVQFDEVIDAIRALAASPAPETPRTTDEADGWCEYCNSVTPKPDCPYMTGDAVPRAPRTMAAQPAAPEGWKLVPKEPTEAMIAATNDALEQVNGIILLAAATGRGHIDAHRDGPPLVRAYRAMLAASPEAPGAQADARSTSDAAVVLPEPPPAVYAGPTTVKAYTRADMRDYARKAVLKDRERR